MLQKCIDFLVLDSFLESCAKFLISSSEQLWKHPYRDTDPQVLKMHNDALSVFKLMLTFQKTYFFDFSEKKCFYLQKISQRYRCLLLLTSRLSYLFSLPYIYRRRDYRGFLIKNGKYECYSLSLPRNEFLWMAKWLVVPC